MGNRDPDRAPSRSESVNWTPGDVASMIANPFYAINIDEGLDDWGTANVGLIKELDPETYLRNLLSILKGNYSRG